MKVISEIKKAAVEAAQFSENQLQAAANAADSVQLIKGATYLCPVNQLFHGEKSSRGRISNRIYMFEIADGKTRFLSVPYSHLSALYIQTVAEWKADGKQPVEVEERTTESGVKFHRPVVNYHPTTLGGNLIFRLNGSSLESDVFAVKVTDVVSTISCQYETDQQMTSNGHTVRELLMNSDGTARLTSRNSYMLETVDKEELDALLSEYPSTPDELKQFFADNGEASYYEEAVEKWLL